MTELDQLRMKIERIRKLTDTWTDTAKLAEVLPSVNQSSLGMLRRLTAELRTVLDDKEIRSGDPL